MPQYLLVQAIHQKMDLNLFRIPKDDIDDLGNRYFIFTGDKLMLRDKGRLMFEEDNMKELFEEFYNTFPVKTPISNRRLRAHHSESMNGSQAWNIYKRLIKTKDEHNQLMNGLNSELNERKSNNGLEYMHNILAWLRAGSWEMYDIKSDSSDEVFVEVG